MTMIAFRRTKGVMLQSIIPFQHCDIYLLVLFCKRLVNKKKRRKKQWHHEDGTICGNTEAISVDINQKVSANAKMDLPIEQKKRSYCQIRYKLI